MEVNNINPIQSEINPQPIPPKFAKPFPTTLILGITVGVVLTASVASTVYFYQKSKNIPLASNSNNLPSPTTVQSETPSPNKESPHKINWLNKPQKISPVNIFKPNALNTSEEGYYFDKAKYYHVANLGDGSQLINLFIPGEWPGESDIIFRFIKSPDNIISFIKSEELQQIKKYLLDNIQTNPLNFSEFNPPETITIDNIQLKKSYPRSETFDTLTNPKLIKATEVGDLYVVYYPKENMEGIETKVFYLKLKDWTLFTYDQQIPFISDNQIPWLTWNDGSNNQDQFLDKITNGGCSLNPKGLDVIKEGSSLLVNKTPVATFNSSSIYQIKDTNNSFVKKLYEFYKTTSEYITPAQTLSLNDYANLKNHFLYQDFMGDWVIFTNQKFSMQAECGKPVIYLYPQKETQVKVQVGAQISKSDPVYPDKGWVVTAKPNGELIYQNQTYPYLFWEGLGNGVYPNYKNKGTVVAQKDLIKTLYKQLSQLGLNTKESADFMEFWQPRLPPSPYVRLTWLNTKDMDNLAPITVNPKPDTKIRIFLEFEGLDKPVNLIPQKFSAPDRTGFTLIEWGGLLIGK